MSVRTLMATATAALMLAATLTTTGAVAYATAPPPGTPIPLDNDMVLPAPPAGGALMALAETGPGWTGMDGGPYRNAPSYTFRLVSNNQGNVEALRSAAQQAAVQIGQISGVQISIAAGTVPDGTPDREPVPGEILMSFDGSVEGKPTTGWAGYGGPRQIVAQGDKNLIRSGRIWIHPLVAGYTAAQVRHVVAHELGHAIGLGHHDSVFEGTVQVMNGTPGGYAAEGVYRNGDKNGLRHLAPTQQSPTGQRGISQMWPTSAGWVSGATGLQIASPSSISAASTGGTWPQALGVHGTLLTHIWGEPTGWKQVPTGVSIGAGASVSAVVHNKTLQALAVDGGQIYQIWPAATGWQKLATGMQVPAGSKISAVNLGGGWPQALAIEAGKIYHIWGDSNGWHNVWTGVSVTSGAELTAVNQGGSLQALVSDGGRVYQVFGANGAWHKWDTGISGVPHGSPLSGVGATGWPQAFVVLNGVVHHILANSTGWKLMNSGVPARSASMVQHNNGIQAILTN